MFFLNQDIKYVVVDFSSIKEHGQLLSALESCHANYERVFFLDWRGRDFVSAIVNGNYPRLATKAVYYPEDKEDFGWLLLPLDEFLSAGQIGPLDCLFISQSPHNLEAAQMRPFGTVILSPTPIPLDIAKVGTDFIVENWNELPEIFSGNYIGHWGEVCISPSDAFIRRSTKASGRLLQVHNPNLERVSVYYGGRYLSSDDEASKRHLYTAHILAAKYRPEVQGVRFEETMKALVSFIIKNEQLDPIITYVPPRPTQADRMALFLKGLSSDFGSITCVLKCVKDYAKQKEAGHYALRAKNIEGAFQCQIEVKGRDILLIDDIGTSFHTVNECAKTLLKAGARKVAVLVLGVTCDKSGIVLQKIQCASCGKPFALRFNKNNGNPFWACTGFPECKHLLSFSDGLKQLRILDRSDINF